MRSLFVHLAILSAAIRVGAQPCTPDFIDQPEFYRYQVLGGGTALATFDDGRGSAVYAAVGDLRGGHFLRLTGPGTPEPVGLGVAGLEGDARVMRVLDLDGAGGEPPKMYAAGVRFTSRVWRFDGDAWEALPAQLPPFGLEVLDLVAFDDGSGRDLYITGNFGTHHGLRWEDGPHGVARWDEAAQQWAPLGEGLWREDASDNVIGRVMAVFDEDGAGPKRPALFIGGAFNRAGEMEVPGLVRWDGADFSLVGDLKRDDEEPVVITAMFVHDDGSGEALYIGGTFHEADGVRSPGLVRWDGERFSDVGGGLPPAGFADRSYARTLSTWREDGKDLLMVGGHWLRWAPAPDAFHATLMLWDGAEWRSLMTEGLDEAPRIVDAVATFEEGRQVVYIMGRFGEFDGRLIQGLARWDGEQWSGYHTGLGQKVTKLDVFDDGAGPRLIISSQGTIHDRFTEGLASWDGQELAEYPIPGVPNEAIHSESWTAATRKGRDHVYLSTRKVPGTSATSDLIWEYDGNRTVQIAEVNLVKPRTVRQLFAVEYDDGSGPALHMAGNFHDVEGRVLGDVIKWNGSEWLGLGEGLRFAGDTQSASLIVFDDGSGPAIYVGGRNMLIGGEQTLGGLARWDGERWEGSVGDYELPGGISGESWDLEVYQGKLHAILALVHPAGYIVPGVARLDGETWTVLGLTNAERFGMIRDLHVFDDGSGEKLYVTGEFPELAGVDARGGIIWDGEMWTPMSGGFDPLVAGDGPQAMAVYDVGDGEGPDLYIGGNYSTVIDATGEVIPTGRLARWRGCRDSCPADLTGDGALDFADFVAFQMLFAAMDPGADFDGDEAFTFFDFLAFQNAFAAGCP